MLRIKRALAALCTAVLLLVVTVIPASAYINCSFESGIGRDGQAIGTSVPGLVFSTTTGGDVYFADINSHNYSTRSDNGKVHEDGEYFVSGDGAAYITQLASGAKVSFTYGLASYFTTGYSSQFLFVLEAYDTSGDLLSSVSGPANAYSQGGTGLNYLTVYGSGIAYVVVHDQGGYWMIDNVSTDAVLPEPSSLLVLAAGLAGISGFTVRRRK